MKYEKIEKEIVPKIGLSPGSNDLFQRYYWEFNPYELGKKRKWFSYVKGGGSERFYNKIIWLIDWENSGQRIKNYKDAAGNLLSRPQNTRYYFKEGLTFNKVSSEGLIVKYLPPGHIFADTACGIFTETIDNQYLLGFLNSKLINYLTNVINPTIGFQAGDLKRIPFKPPGSMIERIVSNRSKHCLSIKKSLFQFDINDRYFKQTAIQYGKSINPNETKLENLYKIYLNHREEEYVKLHTYEAMIDKEIFALYEIDGEDLEQILREQGTPAGYFPVINRYELIPEDTLPEAKEYIKNLDRKDLSGDDLNRLGLKLKALYEKGKSIEEISIAVQINPVSVAAMRKELGLVNQKDLKHEVENLLTYLILEQLKKDEDGIIPISEETQEFTLTKRLISDLETLFGDEHVDSVLSEMKSILGRDLTNYRSTEFFKKHISQYKKRPIIWHVKSKRGYFECFMHYHKLDNQTLLRLKHQYLAKAMEIHGYQLSEQKNLLTASEAKPAKSVYQTIERLELILEDLEDFDSRLDTILATGYDPIIDDGVMVIIAPLQDAGILSSDVLSKSQIEKAYKLGEEMKKDRQGGINPSLEDDNYTLKAIQGARND